MNTYRDRAFFATMAIPAAPSFPGCDSTAGCFAVVCFAVLLAWDGPAMAQADFVRGAAQPIELVGDKIPVNTTTSGYQRDADVVMEDNGSFAVVWRGWDQDSIHAQRFDWDGNPVGEETLIAAGGGGAPAVVWSPSSGGSPQAVAGPTSSTNVLWGDYFSIADAHLNARTIGPDSFTVDLDAIFPFSPAPAVAPGPLGAYYRVVSRNREDTAYNVQLRNAKHELVRPAFQVEAPGPGSVSVVDELTPVIIPVFRPPALTASTEPGAGPAAGPPPVFCLVSYIWEDTGGLSVVSGRFYDQDDSPVGSEFQINDPAETTFKDDLSTADNVSGLVMAVWRSGLSVVMRLIDAQGPLPGWYLVSADQFSELRGPDVTAAGNYFLVTWERKPFDKPYHIMARLIDVSDPLAPFGGPEITISDSGRWPAIAADAQGRAVVVWEDGDGDQDGIYAQRLQLLSDSVFLDRFEEVE